MVCIDRPAILVKDTAGFLAPRRPSDWVQPEAGVGAGAEPPEQQLPPEPPGGGAWAGLRGGAVSGVS